jgi:hypothetical protein
MSQEGVTSSRRLLVRVMHNIAMEVEKVQQGT